MSWLRETVLRLQAALGGRRNEELLDEELDTHLALLIEQKIERGMSSETARREARLSLGGADQIKESVRERRGLPLLETLLQDFRFAGRILRKNLSFSVIVVLTLSLGIGANTAIFSFVYGILLAPLPFRDAPRLVVLNETTPRVGDVSVSYPNFLDWRAQNRSFSQMAYIQQMTFNLAGAGVSQPENINADSVSPNFLSMMGVRPFLGRDFDASEEKAGSRRVLLLSYDLWQSHFGGDPNAVGREITLDGKDFAIVGVLPSNYRWFGSIDVMLPIGVWVTNNPDATAREARGDSTVVGRLGQGVEFAQARVQMEGIESNLAREYPMANDQFGVRLRPIRNAFAGNLQTEILVLFTAVVFVLLIACANVANLLLSRGAARTKEIALRMALGASRVRLIRQMLTESLVLTVLGATLGLGFALTAIRIIMGLIPKGILAGASVGLDSAVLLFTASVVVLATFAFGMAPAVHLTKRDVQAELKEGGRTANVGAAQNRLREVLTVMETSLALVLLVGAGLMVKSLYRLINVDPGFKPDRVLKMGMYLSSQRYSKDPAVLDFWQRVLDGARALPGVESAALGRNIPLTDNHGRTDITIEGMALPKPGSFPHPDVHTVSQDYIRTMGMTLERGRTFSDADNEHAPPVALVNDKLARQYWPHQDPVGKRFMWGQFDPNAKKPPEWVTVVGVVDDTKLYGLANPARLEVYDPFRQDVNHDMDLVVRARLAPSALTSEIRSMVASVDKDEPIFAIATMNKLVSDDLSAPRLALVLLGLFSALAMVLAAIGIYGVVSYSVVQRTHEIAVRVTLGAQPREVLRMVLSQAGKMAAIGIAIGIVAAFGLTRLMSSLLFSIGASDPATFAAVAILLGLVAISACYIPARRAMRVDPMVALRYE